VHVQLSLALVEGFCNFMCEHNHISWRCFILAFVVNIHSVPITRLNTKRTMKRRKTSIRQLWILQNT